MEIGSRIREVRELKRIKLNELAHLAGISRVYLSDIERNKKMPLIPTLERICAGLGITLADFFTEEKSELAPELCRLLETAKKLTPEQQEYLQKLLEAMGKE
ncbi:MAG TPA: helix-turn-helix transcriptional regulator [Methylomusa anaerophila]|uniref:HTH-type transcriptional regulator SinR n=1 Tax=Methylomusa anaerophila TaxID=1930071 RepID=A0A348AHE1_9FIRM|nr:helix-turn-helix transcriptional regulator [Methylomusa anaerophila]BBB90489.1 HTH-type transcriptional regulator SinR [Methylomusa anaerophila]HML89868.1 helix-turn-helix transcriptional regulator [Methylomusa anaerophila]